MLMCDVRVIVGTTPTFIELVQKLYLERYTGPYVVHALHGNPQMVEFPREQVQIALDTRRTKVA